MSATYRLQLHADFDFAAAARRVPYLAALGVTHVYLSPVLQAAPGSQHGYDVVDHDTVSRDLGGEDGLVALARTAHDHGLGVVVDVVPNHMAWPTPTYVNAPLWEVLAEGPRAARAHWFDVDWRAGEGRIGVPVLGRPLKEVLADGELTLGEHDGAPVLRYFDQVFPVAEGTLDGAEDDLATLLARQHYRLADWREKAEVLNYRRFFDVDTLIAVRVEADDVFDATHRLLLDLNHRGVVDAFRIDHPDGLADPEAYLRRLRRLATPGTRIWVEKILEGAERLPEAWDCDGTTGYDGLKAITAALIDPECAGTLTEAWQHAGGDGDLHEVEDRAKRTVVEGLLAPEDARLLRRAAEVLPDADPDRLGEALTELLVAGEVYRAYVDPADRPSPLARRRIARARDVAGNRRPDLAAELDALADLATGDATHPAAADFAVRFQQTWGPVMAKGIEDTTFYRWHRMVALNEVGGDPALVDRASPEVLHSWAVDAQEQWPESMVALSTHDTKRSEDVRARLLAVAGDQDAWTRCTAAFAEAADDHGVDRPTAHLLWQTLVGTGQIPRERLHGYLTKALREGKQHTTWTRPDEDYEARVLALADAATAAGPLRTVVDETLAANATAVRAAVLGQKLLQLTVPGTPDLYQGNEICDASLVDPDNRRPVDYDHREQRLDRLRDAAPADLDDEKLLVTSRALRLRTDHPGCFGEVGAYEPLHGTSEHLLGFRRGRYVVVLVTRAVQRLDAAGGWAEETVELPEGRWRDMLTGTPHPGGPTRRADLLAGLPVALLVAEDA